MVIIMVVGFDSYIYINMVWDMLCVTGVYLWKMADVVLQLNMSHLNSFAVLIVLNSPLLFFLQVPFCWNPKSSQILHTKNNRYCLLFFELCKIKRSL